jgi:hypothetical protein
MSVSRSHQCPFLGSFLGKPTLQRFPIGIDCLCSTDVWQRNIINVTCTWTLTSHPTHTPTPPHHQRNIIMHMLRWTQQKNNKTNTQAPCSAVVNYMWFKTKRVVCDSTLAGLTMLRSGCICKKWISNPK